MRQYSLAREASLRKSSLENTNSKTQNFFTTLKISRIQQPGPESKPIYLIISKVRVDPNLSYSLKIALNPSNSGTKLRHLD